MITRRYVIIGLALLGTAGLVWRRQRRISRQSSGGGIIAAYNRLIVRGNPYIPIPFAYNSDVIPAESQSDLDAVAAYLQANPSLDVEIVGHTDNVGGAEFNWTLGRDRAESVWGYLTLKGCNPDKLYPASMGEDEPIADNATEAGRAQNRRVEFVVMT